MTVRQYNALSGSYDALMGAARYPERAQFFTALLRESSIPVHSVLDLGCGTGTVSWLLYRHGFRVTAVDNAEEMLTEAVQKGDAFSGTASPDVPPPLFVCQSMPRLKLPAPVDGVVSTLDSLNYLTTQRDIRETFRRVGRYLRPGGRFVFDLNTPSHFRRMHGQTYLDETEDSFCVWQTFFSEKKQICVWQVDLFRRRPDGAWTRSYEEHRERAWHPEQIQRFLSEAGFSRVQIMGDLSRESPHDAETRWTVLAEKEQST